MLLVGGFSGGLEGEGQTAAQGALLLGKEEQGTVAQNTGLVALGQQVAHIQQGFDMDTSVGVEMEGLTQMQVQIGCVGFGSEGSHLGQGVLGLPTVAGPPMGARSFEGAGEGERVHLRMARSRLSYPLTQICCPRCGRDHHGIAIGIAEPKLATTGQSVFEGGEKAR